MKSSFVILTGSSAAQTVPNFGFETWAITPPAPFESADAWSGGPSVSKSMNAHSGAFAIQLQTAVYINPNTGSTDTIPGAAYSGTQGAVPGIPGIQGFAFSLRSDSLTGWYTYSSVSNDGF